MAHQRVVAVGGGVLGTMHAVFAVRLGATVVHLERHDRPRGASVRNFGLVWVSGRSPGPELALALRARELWEQVGHDVPATGFRKNGSVTVVSSESELKVLEAAVARNDASERGFSLLDAGEVRALNPGLQGEFLAGLHCSLDAAVEPRLVLGALRDWLEKSGRYEFLAPREVVEVASHGVTDATGASYEGDLVVLCPGAASGGVMGSLLEGVGLQAVRLQMAETEPLGRQLTTSVADGNSLRYYPAFKEFSALLPAHRDEALSRFGIQLLCQQRVDGALTLGDTHEYEEPFSFELSDEATELVRGLAIGALGTPFPQIRRRWVGVYHQLVNVSDDELYLRREVAPGAVVVTGVGGRGMTLSPAVAEATFS
ncbi:MAG: TIGR03364 family FAD-dependent oxidoreductase [Acidimicrobiales bacterium]|jgi:FAD dependent oxidoreductase TIGR03364